MTLKASLKKLLLLTGFISLGATAQAAVTAQSYNWDFTNSEAVIMGGTSHSGSFTTATEDINGVSTTVLTASSFAERGTNVFREILNASQNGEGMLTFSMDISWGGNNSKENIFHVARNGNGVSLGLVNGKLGLVNGNLNSVPENALSLTANTWTSVTVSLLGSDVTITLTPTGSEESATYTSTLNTISWFTGSEDGGDTQNEMYSLGHQAPGWNNNGLNGTKLANLSVSYAPIPEPTTATLTVIALAGLVLRRRRA